MKEKKIVHLLSQADERFVKEAEPRETDGKTERSPAKKHKSRPPYLRPVALAASFVLLFSAVAITLVATLGRPDYSGSAYYPVIEKMTAYNEKQKDYGFGGAATAPGSTPPPTDAGSAEGSAAVEITDHQTAGVREANRIARTADHIFYLDGATLRVFSVAEEQSTEVGAYTVGRTGDDLLTAYTTQAEFFLSRDGKTVTLFFPYRTKDGSNFVDLVPLDVSTPSHIVEGERLTVSGSYVTVRETKDAYLLMTTYTPSDIDFSKEESFVPGVRSEGTFCPVPADNILLPRDDLSSLSYTVVTRLPFDGGTPDTVAFLSYAREVYVSESRVYATHTWYETNAIERGREESILKSDIARVNYSDGRLTAEPAIVVEGGVENRFCLDEADGILRAVTTVRRSVLIPSEAEGETGSSASLFCFSLESGECVASVRRFAPTGESVRSARFDGDSLYVCTSILNTDPVFFFDLSDLSNITVKDTGTIDGFSTSLISFGDYLLGIGEGADRFSLKIEVYEETETGVRSIARYLTDNTQYADEYKAYAIDREASVLGLGIFSHMPQYLVFRFDGESLRCLTSLPVKGDPELMRGCLVGSWFYAFGGSSFKVAKVLDD